MDFLLLLHNLRDEEESPCSSPPLPKSPPFWAEREGVVAEACDRVCSPILWGQKRSGVDAEVRNIIQKQGGQGRQTEQPAICANTKQKDK